MTSAEHRPRLVLWTSFLMQLPLQLFISFWAGGFIGGLLTTLFPVVAAALSARFGSPFLLVGLATLVLFPLVTLCVKSLNYRNTIYRLCSDRVEIEEGFLTQHRKEILFSSIREISLRRGILQRLAGLGSIYVGTAATGQGASWSVSAILGATSTFKSGAMLMDLVDYEAAYAQMRESISFGGPQTD
jgi:uncharacterized membrane protein YdbT with pleckstrin-like domain